MPLGDWPATVDDRNTEFTVVRNGQLAETHVFFGGSYENSQG